MEHTYKVPAVEQAIRIMLCLADSGSSSKSLTDICREVGIHRSKAFSILNTLLGFGLVRKNPNRRGYTLGLGMLTLVGKMLENLNLPQFVEPILYDLAKKAGATVALGVISDNKTFVVAQFEGAPGLGVSAPIGHVAPITYGAHGKIIAAFLSEKELDELLESNKQELLFYGKTENFDKARFMKEIAQCRLDGFAIELGDMVPGMNAIAAPVLDEEGRPIGYITVVGFFTREHALRIGPLAAAVGKTVSKETGNKLYWKKGFQVGNKSKTF
jgi:DNA-binding IclR family transcriptional regulator